MLMYLQKLRKSKKGYTLTELIVVVAILGVLAAVATPLVVSRISDARDAADEANARTIENIIKIAFAEGKYTDSINGDEAYDLVIASLGEMPEVQGSGTFYVKSDGSKVICGSEPTIEGTWYEIGEGKTAPVGHEEP